MKDVKNNCFVFYNLILGQIFENWRPEDEPLELRTSPIFFLNFNKKNSKNLISAKWEIAALKK